MQTRFIFAGAVLASLLAPALAGCTVTTSLTVDSSNVENAAARALEKQVGSKPTIDCGSKQIDLVDGTTVHCTVGAPGDSTEYDSVVTISDVHGTKYHVEIEVASTPKG